MTHYRWHTTSLFSYCAQHLDCPWRLFVYSVRRKSLRRKNSCLKTNHVRKKIEFTQQLWQFLVNICSLGLEFKITHLIKQKIIIQHYMALAIAPNKRKIAANKILLCPCGGPRVWKIYAITVAGWHIFGLVMEKSSNKKLKNSISRK
jgi:hypothetical protein